MTRCVTILLEYYAKKYTALNVHESWSSELDSPRLDYSISAIAHVVYAARRRRKMDMNVIDYTTGAAGDF